MLKTVDDLQTIGVEKTETDSVENSGMIHEKFCYSLLVSLQNFPVFTAAPNTKTVNIWSKE